MGPRFFSHSLICVDATGWYTYFETSSIARGAQAGLQSPLLPGNNPNYCQMEFFYHMYGDHVGSLSVRVSEGDVYKVRLIARECHTWTERSCGRMHEPSSEWLISQLLSALCPVSQNLCCWSHYDEPRLYSVTNLIMEPFCGVCWLLDFISRLFGWRRVTEATPGSQLKSESTLRNHSGCVW